MFNTLKVWLQRYKYVSLAATLLLYWGFGFYPFQWEMPFQVIDNGLSPVPQGLRFSGPGIAYTRTAPEWLKSAISESSLKIDLIVRTASAQQTGPARILTISRDTLLRDLTIGQEGADLVIRIRTPDTSQNGIPAYRIKGVFAVSRWHRIVMSITPGKLLVRIDGNIALPARLPEKALAGWSPTYHLALGNEFTYDRPWLGDIRQARITAGPWKTDYTLKNTLYLPQRYFIQNAQYTLLPFIGKTIDIDFLLDFIVNLTGFIPLGILLMIISERRLSIVSATALAAALSLSIELGQLFFAERYTETDDFMLNTLGGMIGAWLYTRNNIAYDST